ncbi:MAG: metallophosphoesterase family protein [Thermoprotei archaeon]
MVLASSDIHVPRFSEQFIEATQKEVEEAKPQILLLAGDVVNKGDPSALGDFLDRLSSFYGGPLVACQGNEEYEETFDDVVHATAGKIRWLIDELEIFDLGGEKLAVFGTKGVLDRPTYWQRTHIKDIWKIRGEQIKTIREYLEKLRNTKADAKIVLSHYSPTKSTMVGEREKMWPEMGYPRFEEELAKGGFDAWVHGHIHKGTVESVKVGEVQVYNVAFPARKKPVWVVRSD